MTDPYLEMSDLHPNPLNEFATWYAKARAHNIGLAHAMSLATVDKRGRPAARMVLLSEFGPQGFSFYSHYQSCKGLEICERPYAALVFYWRELDRQIRVEGKVVKAPDEQSDTYFATRPRESQLWAWASPQSTEMKSRQELLDRFDEFSGRFG
ncbi:MAG TPA: pyridoxamine 5'-phosphate oxidase, partial [Candidatus Latescibacteria bacterium]|nr:pyridoxamine 5'-phosphate oxidase [Candidatus Handelsmanbacteria bacterium]HIL09331.1 pyridoxamine 5'-phosphate oxidase [Candidatus Latescibacterota bacterium]